MSGPKTETVDPRDPAAYTLTRIFVTGERIAGRYEVRRVLGSGGSAIVYAVRDHELGDEIALKVLRPEKATEIHIERSRREAAMARASSSPRLVRTFDLHQEGGLVLLPMELIDGGSLRDRIRRGPLPIDEVIRTAADILEALVVLHGLGIIHRDLKPANLLLTSDGALKISDFGLARRWMNDDESRLTSTGTPLGTLDYISPEQALGDDVDPRTDLYSFGVILFELLTGHLPFHATSAIGAVVRRFKERPPDVRTLRPDTPAWLAGIVERLLASDREQRYATAQAVLDDLHNRRGARRRWFLPAAAIAALVIVAVAGWLLWPKPKPEFARLVDDGARGVRALDAKGNEIWSNAYVHRFHAGEVQRIAGTKELAAVLLPPKSDHDPDAAFTLSFLDPRNGRQLRTRRLPNASYYFPEFGDHWGLQRLSVTDLNRDGASEVLVTYGHMFYPSFIVLYDLGRDESRVLFVANGHHSVRAIEDLDGDGHLDLILAGIANKLGWNTAVAAIRVRLDESWSRRWPVSTPDMEVPVEKGALLWYVLTPPGTLHEQVTVDRARRTVRVEYLTRVPVEIPLAHQSPEREQAYERLREVVRLANNGAFEPALSAIPEVKRLATKAGDAVLAEWIDRVAATTLVQAGRIDEGEELFVRIHAQAFSPSDVAYDAATALHLAGVLPRATKWYRAGLIGHPSVGRLKYEYVLGSVLALCEMKRSDEALRAIESFAGTESDHGDLATWFRAYVAWREDAAIPTLTADPQNIDFMRYWWIEFALARRVSPKRVLKMIDAEESRTSEYDVLLGAARAEALYRAGDYANALKHARSAFQRSTGKLRRDVHIRAHFDLVAERYARLAALQGFLDEAAKARNEAANVRWRANGMTGETDALSRRALSE